MAVSQHSTTTIRSVWLLVLAMLVVVARLVLLLLLHRSRGASSWSSLPFSSLCWCPLLHVGHSYSTRLGMQLWSSSTTTGNTGDTGASQRM